MDSFTRNYSIVLAGVVIALLVWWLSSVWQPRVWEINGMLEEDPTLAEYPYPFRLRSLDDGVATLWSPRNFQVPAIQFLAIVHPGLAGLAQDDPKVMAAQQKLIEHQKHAQALVLSLPDVERVDWVLDTQWLASHGVQVNAG